jgi:hypothetical protein
MSPGFYAPFPDDGVTRTHAGGNYYNDGDSGFPSMPRRERVYAESKTCEEAGAFMWCNEEEEKNSIVSKSSSETGNKAKTPIFKEGSPSSRLAEILVKKSHPHQNPFGGSYAFFQAPSPPFQGNNMSVYSTQPPPPSSPPSTISSSDSPLNNDPFFKSFFHEASSSMETDKTQEHKSLSPYSSPNKENRVPLGCTTTYYAVLKHSDGVKRTPLADISKDSRVISIPETWFKLYRDRPSQDDPKDIQQAWMESVYAHLRPLGHTNPPGPPGPPGPPLQTPAVLSTIDVHSIRTGQFSPISMPSALQSTRGKVHNRSSFKNHGPGFATGQAVRFRHPLTSIKPPAKINPNTPTTWPKHQVYPDVPTGKKSNVSFRDVWENHESVLGQSGWIPYKTPEQSSSGASSSPSKSSKSSSSSNQLLVDTMSADSKTTVMIPDKENTMVSTQTSTVKSVPSRLKAKKLNYEVPEGRELNEIL